MIVATAERVAHAGLGGIEALQGGGQRVIASPFERLWKEGLLSSREYEAGQKYTQDSYTADLNAGAPGVDWNRIGTAGNPVPTMSRSQRIADARVRMRWVQRDIPEHSLVAQLLKMALIDETRFDDMARIALGITSRRDGIPATRAGLRVALAALADHYGI